MDDIEFLDDKSAKLFAKEQFEADDHIEEAKRLEETDKTETVEDGPQPPPPVAYWNDDSGEAIVL